MKSLMIRHLNKLSIAMAMTIIDVALIILFFILANNTKSSGLMVIGISFIVEFFSNIFLIIKGIKFGHKMMYVTDLKEGSDHDKKVFNILNLISSITMIIHFVILIVGIIITIK